jgi:DNA-binding LacI/PurR family transcriptional regulator
VPQYVQLLECVNFDVSHKPSLRDIAKQANVSLGTVSNVLNRPQQVSEETRQKVRSAIDMLGFIPNEIMQSSTKDSQVIGLILPLSNNPFYEELAQGIEDAVAKEGLRVLIGYSREDEAIELHLLSAMVDAGFKGVILTPVGVNAIKYLKSSLIKMCALVTSLKPMIMLINVQYLLIRCAVDSLD